ncbi:MAG: hypothetical protein ACPGXX_12865 [Planctomycetaceae bacterium]
MVNPARSTVLTIQVPGAIRLRRRNLWMVGLSRRAGFSSFLALAEESGRE